MNRDAVVSAFDREQARSNRVPRPKFEFEFERSKVGKRFIIGHTRTINRQAQFNKQSHFDTSIFVQVGNRGLPWLMRDARATALDASDAVFREVLDALLLADFCRRVAWPANRRRRRVRRRFGVVQRVVIVHHSIVDCLTRASSAPAKCR